MKSLLLVAMFAACGSRTELDVRDATATATADACALPLTLELDVPTTAAWFDTGIDVTVGTRVVIHAQGIVRYGPMPPQTQDANGGNFDGQRFFSTAVAPNAVVLSLIGKIGGTTQVATGQLVPEGKAGDGQGFVGTDYDEVMTTSGRLFLGYNDQIGAFGDNSGDFMVTITTSNPC